MKRPVFCPTPNVCDMIVYTVHLGWEVGEMEWELGVAGGWVGGWQGIEGQICGYWGRGRRWIQIHK